MIYEVRGSVSLPVWYVTEAESPVDAIEDALCVPTRWWDTDWSCGDLVVDGAYRSDDSDGESAPEIDDTGARNV